MAASLMDRLRFLGRFFLKPTVVGAVAPSSQFLVDELIKDMGVSEAKCLAELGPGTGVATRTILEKKNDACPLLAVEKDLQWVKLLRRRYPDLDLVHGDAAELHQYAAERQLPPFDAVICGLPFTVFGEPLQRAILESIQASLRPGGSFSTFAYVHGKELPAGKRFRSLLEESFARVETSEVIWRNTPPAVVYRAWAASGDS